MRSIRSCFLVLSLVAILVTGMLPAAVFAQDDTPTGAGHVFMPALQTQPGTEPAPAGVVTHAIPSAEQTAASQFWTRERMLAAKPLDLLTVNGKAPAASPEVAATGPAVRFPGAASDPKAVALAQKEYAAEWARIAAEETSATEQPQAEGDFEAESWASTPPFVSYYVNDATQTWKSAPWVTMGRLFFKIPGYTGLYACSASVAYGRTLWTAGHCVFSTGRGWHTDMTFVPAYRNGAYPFGSFVAINAATTPAWFSSGNLSADIGMVSLASRSGWTVSQYVGRLGFLYNANGVQQFHAFGYPSNFASGAFLVACAASTYRRDTIPGPPPVGIGCNMGSGSSGGPWLVAYAPFRTASVNYVNSVVSYRYDGQPNLFYGPYFGSEAKQLWDWAVLQ
ncbi:MAG: hypothetical protein IPK16_07390 [Anaerolineales bacterium]|nr:hypothetical protein [Anaerolineales bacterium]